MNKTILFLIDDYHIGGATSFLYQHAKALFLKGNKIIILACRGNLVEPEKTFPFATLITVPNDCEFGSILGRVKWCFSYFNQLNKIHQKYTIQTTYSLLIYSAIISFFHPKTWNTLNIYIYCGDVSLETQSLNNGRTTISFKIKNFVRHVIQFLVLSFVDRIVVFSYYSIDLIKKRFSPKLIKKIYLIPAYAESLKSKKSKSKSPIFRIVMITRFEPRKGISLFLKSLKILKDMGLEYEVIIAGPSDDIYLPKAFEEYQRLNLFLRVRFVHAVSNSQKKYLLDTSDLLVIPSIDLETFGMVTLEAMSYGIPVIGTPIGATKEILSKIDDRLLSKETTPESFSRAIYEYMRLSNMQKKIISDKIRDELSRSYSRKMISQKIYELNA